MPADNKNQFTIKLRPIVMASLQQVADGWGMPVPEFVENFRNTARMSPDGVRLKLPDVPLKPEPATAVEPMLPLGGGL